MSPTPSTPNPWVAIAIAGIPEVAKLVTSIIELRKAYPQVTPDEINLMVSQITSHSDSVFDDVLAKVAADQSSIQAKIQPK